MTERAKAGIGITFNDAWLIGGVRTPFVDYNGALAHVSLIIESQACQVKEGQALALPGCLLNYWQPPLSNSYKRSRASRLPRLAAARSKTFA